MGNDIILIHSLVLTFLVLVIRDIFSNKRRTLRKMRKHLENWDTMEKPLTCVYINGDLVDTNSMDLGELSLIRSDYLRLIKFIEKNT